jgi:hypothetical protein
MRVIKAEEEEVRRCLQRFRLTHKYAILWREKTAVNKEKRKKIFTERFGNSAKMREEAFSASIRTTKNPPEKTLNFISNIQLPPVPLLELSNNEFKERRKPRKPEFLADFYSPRTPNNSSNNNTLRPLLSFEPSGTQLSTFPELQQKQNMEGFD